MAGPTLLPANIVSSSTVGSTIISIGHGLVLPSNGVLPVKFVGGTWSAAVAGEVDMIVVEIIDANTFRVVLSGFITVVGHGLTAGSVYYADASTAGTITSTEPVAPNASDPLLKPMSADLILIYNHRGISV